MKMTIKIKLNPSKAQFDSLKKTMEIFNATCDDISEFCFKNKCFSKFMIQKEIYHNLRKKYSLSAQLMIRAIAKVAESYKAEKERQHFFKPHGAIIYDQRILSYKGLEKVSLSSLDGRLIIPMILGGYQEARMDRIKGQADLVFIENVFYLLATIDMPEKPNFPYKRFIGVDLGIVNIATTSDGDNFSGEKIENVRQKYSKLRRNLQKCGSQSAKRKLKKIRRKESNFRRDTNHCISKILVQKAKDTFSAIRLEKLTNIRKKTTVRKSERAKHSGWSFYQLQSFISYKAQLEGVIIEFINPKNTSRKCPVLSCGHIEKKNRKTQSLFICSSCGYTANADLVGAINISRAGVDQPIVSSILSFDRYKPTTLVVGN